MTEDEKSHNSWKAGVGGENDENLVDRNYCFWSEYFRSTNFFFECGKSHHKIREIILSGVGKPKEILQGNELNKEDRNTLAW